MTIVTPKKRGGIYTPIPASSAHRGSLPSLSHFPHSLLSHPSRRFCFKCTNRHSISSTESFRPGLVELYYTENGMHVVLLTYGQSVLGNPLVNNSGIYMGNRSSFVSSSPAAAATLSFALVISASPSLTMPLQRNA